MDGACSTHSTDDKYKFLVEITESKRPLGGSRRRWEDNIRMYHQEVGRECVD